MRSINQLPYYGPDEADIDVRARRAYHRRFGPNAPIPTVEVDLPHGYVTLHNVNGPLGVYEMLGGFGQSPFRLRYAGRELR